MSAMTRGAQSVGSALPIPPLIIREANQLRTLRKVAIRSGHPLVLELPGLSAEQARAAGERIASYRQECGCSFGAKCMVAAFGGSVLWLAFRYGLLTAQFAWRLPWTVIYAFIGAAVGKTIGIAQARFRLNNEIERLIAVRTTGPTEV